MSRRKITDGLHQRADGRWERKEKINGKTHWFSSLDPAEVWKKRDAAVAAGPEEQAQKDAGPTFNTVADTYEEHVRDMKYGTQKSYLPAIARARKALGDKHMREIEPYMIAQFLQSMKTSAHTTVSNQKTVINAIFRTWIDSPEWRGDQNPAAMTTIPHGLKKGKRLPPTDAQVKVVKDHYLDPDALPAVVFLCTGERRGEACGIQLRDIDFNGKIIYIRNAVEHIGDRPHITTTKTPAGIRRIPLLKMLEEALQPLRCLPATTYILSGTNKPLTASQYNRNWGNFWRKYGYARKLIYEYDYKMPDGKIKKCKHTEWRANVCAHQFRHEYVCMLAEAGVTEEIAIQIIGHANVKMIHEVYMSLKLSMLQNAQDKLNIFLSRTPTKTPT